MTVVDDRTAEAVPNEWTAEGEGRLYRSLGWYWHPVLYAAQLGDAPVQATLLGRRTVVVRLAGEVRAFIDRCAHRGTAVSLGWVEGDCLRCPYHGWLYDDQGVCVEIPSRTDAVISPRARLERLHAREANGLIYVCAAPEPRIDIPAFPEWSDDSFHKVEIPAYDWQAGAARRTENFVDFSHFAWVHDGVLARRDQPLVPDHEVRREGWELRTRIVVDEPTDTNKTSTLELDSASTTVPGERNYRIALPFTVWIHQTLPGGQAFVLFMACQPIGPKECRTFTFVARNFGLEASDESFIAHQQQIVEADRVIAESQLPEELSTDLSEEMYVRGADQISVEYRRWHLELVEESERVRGDGSNR